MRVSGTASYGVALGSADLPDAPALAVLLLNGPIFMHHGASDPLPELRRAQKNPGLAWVSIWSQADSNR